MDKRTLFDQFHRVDTNISSVGKDLKEIQEKMNQLIEENATLQIENQHLRDRIEYMTKEMVHDLEQNEPEMSKSRQNLQKLYEDGFHVCNVYFGTRRMHDESCVFCLDVIYGEREQKS